MGIRTISGNNFIRSKSDTVSYNQSTVIDQSESISNGKSQMEYVPVLPSQECNNIYVSRMLAILLQNAQLSTHFITHK